MNTVTAEGRSTGAGVGRVLLLVFGGLLTLIAIPLLVAGGVIGWAYVAQRDDQGYLATRMNRLNSPTYAITSQEIDLGTDPRGLDWAFGPARLGTVRLRAVSEEETPVFIGIAREAEVERYLAGVAHDEIVQVDSSFPDIGGVDVRYRREPGDRKVQPPAAESFWAASVSGPGTQTLTWDLRAGKWAAVLMNADARPRVDVVASVGAKSNWLLPLWIGLLAGGALLLAGGVAMVVAGANRLAPPAPAAPPLPAAPPTPAAAEAAMLPAESLEPSAATAAAAGSPAPLVTPTDDTDGALDPHARVYPLRLDGRLDEPLSRWLWLVKWLLAIPHYVVLAFLWLAFSVLTVMAFFVILVTGRYPRGIFEFNVGVLRWTWRVAFYSFSAIGTDTYPPFTLEDVPDYPARLDVDYPERLSRGLVLIKWWLLAIPQYIIVSLLGGGLWSGGSWGWAGLDEGFSWGSFPSSPGGGLIGILVLAAGVVLLVTQSYPRDLFRLIIGLNRWVYRVVAYVTLMRDEYPPFHLDMGGRDPGTRLAGVAAQPPAPVAD